MRLTARRAVIVLAAGAAVGFSIFGVLVYRTVNIAHMVAWRRLDRLGITPAELRRYGPAVVIDQAGPKGDLPQVWTE